MAYYYSPARACYMLLLLQPLFYLWFMAPHIAALSFSYNFSNPGDLGRANLTYLSENSTAGDGVIDLTDGGSTWSTGGVAYPQTVRLWDHRTGRRASFTTSFSFAISNSQNNTGGRGDGGMAFFIGTPRQAPPPDSDGGFLGLISNAANGGSPPPSTVGVEFDTYRNEWDPQNATDHIGIDVNSISSQAFYKGLANNSLSGSMSASIKYHGSSKVLSVNLRLADGTVHYLQRTVDLKDAGVPQDATVGFSAATGNESESHQLLSWSFNSTATDPSKFELWAIILLTLASASLAALVAALLWVIIFERKPRVIKHRPCLVPPMRSIKLSVARKFSYYELSAATSNFSKDRELGRGAFGVVYRGELKNPLMPPAVAVKRLTWLMERTRKDYETEVMTLGQLRHKNLVKLVGWCNSGGGGDGGDTLLLVYELVTNGSLDEHLHGSSERRLLTWADRYKIVLGVGHAIEYLHTSCSSAILHRDIKPSNVMLDDDFVAKLGDFGLVRQVDPGQGTSTLRGTVMIGTGVYMDPVCMRKDTVSTASDMYSFGVLLLEIATGRKPEGVLEPGGFLISNTLIDDVRESYAKGQVLRMADERLNGDFDERQMERVLVVGLLCVQRGRKHRPKIRTAVNLLSDLSYPVPQFHS